MIGKSVTWTDSRLSVKITFWLYKRRKKLSILHNWSCVFWRLHLQQNLLNTKLFHWFHADSGSHLLNCEHQFLRHSGLWKTSILAQTKSNNAKFGDKGKILLTPCMSSCWFGWHYLGEQCEQGLTRNRNNVCVVRLQGHLCYNWWLRSTYGIVLYVIPCVNSFAFQKKIQHFRNLFFPHWKEQKGYFLGYGNTRIPWLANAFLKLLKRSWYNHCWEPSFIT